MRRLRAALGGATRHLVKPGPTRPLDPGSIRGVLVCATGGLGNTLLLRPLLQVLRRRSPSTPLGLLLTNRPAATLARECGWADDVEFQPEERWYAGLSAIGLLRQVVARRGYDVCLRTFLTAPAMLRGSLAAFLSGARIRVAYGTGETNPFETHLLQEIPRQSEIDKHLALAKVLGLDVSWEREPLAAPARGVEWAREYLKAMGWDGRKPLLGIHPGSDAAFRAKRWGADRFGELAARAMREGALLPVVLGGPDDREVLREVRAASDPGVVEAAEQDIVETAGLISLCSGFVSNDSGLMHLASALDVPTLALFGPTDPVKNRPLGARTVLHRLGLDCSPCDRETATFRCQGHECLTQMDVGSVLDALKSLLADSERQAPRLGSGAHGSRKAAPWT